MKFKFLNICLNLLQKILYENLTEIRKCFKVVLVLQNLLKSTKIHI